MSEKKSIKETMKAIKNIPKEKMAEIRDNVSAQAHFKVISMIAEAEGWTYEETLDACIGENRVPRYSLYYKMSEPSVILNLKSKKGKAEFAASLPDDEREIFLAEDAEGRVNVRKAEREAIKNTFKGKT